MLLLENASRFLLADNYKLCERENCFLLLLALEVEGNECKPCFAFLHSGEVINSGKDCVTGQMKKSLGRRGAREFINSRQTHNAASKTLKGR